MFRNMRQFLNDNYVPSEGGPDSRLLTQQMVGVVYYLYSTACNMMCSVGTVYYSWSLTCDVGCDMSVLGWAVVYSLWSSACIKVSVMTHSALLFLLFPMFYPQLQSLSNYTCSLRLRNIISVRVCFLLSKVFGIMYFI